MIHLLLAWLSSQLLLGFHWFQIYLFMYFPGNVVIPSLQTRSNQNLTKLKAVWIFHSNPHKSNLNPYLHKPQHTSSLFSRKSHRPVNWIIT
jgi:hypothetical protein